MARRRIHRNGWEIVTAPPVRFRRPRGMLALPDPARGGDLRLVRPFINIDDADWPLLAGWLVGTLRPRGPYAVLLVHGEQGSAESALVRVSRTLVDPNAAPVRREPRNGQDLIIAARNGLVVAFDNVSHLAQDRATTSRGLRREADLVRDNSSPTSRKLSFTSPAQSR